MRHPRPRVNRRDLLRLRRLDDATPASEPASDDLLKASRPAMGSYFEVRLAARTPGAADLAGRVLDRIDELETQMTVYRDESEVSRLNATAHLGPVEVEPALFRLLERALELGRLTGGAYDVTTGALSQAWGFFRGPRRVPDPQSLADARSRTGQHHLTLDPERYAVSFDRAGVAINLGSIGKGYAIDCAAAVVQGHWWPTSALIHGGRSSLYALGSPPGRIAGRWEIALRNPFQPETPLGVLRLRNRGMGTSGTDFQHFESEGRVYGHILDPRTGEPALGPASVTVLAPSAAEADALSTAFYLLGPEAAAAILAERPELGAIFVTEGKADRSPNVLCLGLAEADFSRHP